MQPTQQQPQPEIQSPQPTGAPPQESAQPPQASPSPSFANPAGSSISSQDLSEAKKVIDAISNEFSKVVVGQTDLRLSLMVGVLTGGHILLESVPGLAKTTASQTFAKVIGGSFKRIQCTPDLLPSDIIGTQLYDYSKGDFKTQLGPVHANIVLLDEINRSSAKTQSAMLEAMQEKQVSIGGTKYVLPKPFMVLATQNPIEQEGTYELPEAQLDRFLLKEILGYPDNNQEFEILKMVDSGKLGIDYTDAISEVATLEQISTVQNNLSKVYIDDSLKRYVIQIVSATRNPVNIISPDFAKYIQYGASPRASIAFQQVAKALALIQGRDYVIPEDIKQMRFSILRHRIILNFEAVADRVHSESIIDAIFNAIPTP